MNRAVIFHRLAASEARAAEAWYAHRNPEAAARFRTAVLAAANRIASGLSLILLRRRGFGMFAFGDFLIAWFSSNSRRHPRELLP